MHTQALTAYCTPGPSVSVDPRLCRNLAGRLPCDMADARNHPGVHTLLLPTTDLQVRAMYICGTRVCSAKVAGSVMLIL